MNSVSKVHKVPQGYVVAYISDVKESRIKSLDEVKDQIKPAVIREKKLQMAKKLAEELTTKINGDLKAINGVDSRIAVKNTGRFNFETSIPGVGRSYPFIQAAMNTEVNVISEPVKTNNGYYLIKVISKSDFDSTAYSTQRSIIRNNILQQKKRTFVSNWLTELKEKAEIVDNRYLFFGY